MRAILAFGLACTLLALIWAVQAPLSSYALVRVLDDPSADRAACEAELRRAGNGALLALQGGLASASPQIRLRCARLLAAAGHRDGDGALLDMLGAYGKDPQNPIGAMAETFILSIWEQRDAPEEPARGRLLRIEDEAIPDSEKIAALSETLSHHPAWASGYVRRARVYQRNGDAMEAKRDALIALIIEPHQFEAIVCLSGAYLLLSAPEQALICLEHAARINPRLKETLKKEIQDVLHNIDVDSARRRREQRKETPVAGLWESPRTANHEDTKARRTDFKYLVVVGASLPAGNNLKGWDGRPRPSVALSGRWDGRPRPSVARKTGEDARPTRISCPHPSIRPHPSCPCLTHISSSCLCVLVVRRSA